MSFYPLTILCASRANLHAWLKDSALQLSSTVGLGGFAALRSPLPLAFGFLENPVPSGPGGLQLGPLWSLPDTLALLPACMPVVGSCPAHLVAAFSGVPEASGLCFHVQFTYPQISLFCVVLPRLPEVNYEGPVFNAPLTCSCG